MNGMPLLDTLHHRLDAPIHEPDCQARVVATYQQRLDRERDALRAELVARLGLLSEEAVALEQVFVDRLERTATVVIDDVRFRGRQGSVTLVRPCVYCGSGQFESAPLHSPADVGYALTAWQPTHPICQPEESAYWLYDEA